MYLIVYIYTVPKGRSKKTYIYNIIYICDGETAAQGGCRASKLGSDCSVASWRHKAEPPALGTRPRKSKRGMKTQITHWISVCFPSNMEASCTYPLKPIYKHELNHSESFQGFIIRGAVRLFQ